MSQNGSSTNVVIGSDFGYTIVGIRANQTAVRGRANDTFVLRADTNRTVDGGAGFDTLQIQYNGKVLTDTFISIEALEFIGGGSNQSALITGQNFNFESVTFSTKDNIQSLSKWTKRPP